MKKFLSCIFALLLFVQCTLLAGCALTELEFNINEGYDEPIVEYVDPDYVFNVSCGQDTTTISLAGIGYNGDVAQLVYIKPYEYLYGESQTGVCENTNATPTLVGEYNCGQEAEFVIDRYDEAGYDTVYCKFYVIDSGNEILAGPIYATEIAAKNQHEEVVQVVGKKGVMYDYGVPSSIVVDLGCSFTELNFVISGMIVPLETYDATTGQVIPIEYEEHLDENGKGYIIGPDSVHQEVEAYVHNGTKYYFRTSDYMGFAGVNQYDARISDFTRYNIKVSLIMLLTFCDNQYIQPYFISYPDARTATSSSFRAINTSNQYGAGYWGALMGFIAERYSTEEDAATAKYGTVETFIIENEIDLSNSWNVIVDRDKHEPIDIEDYSFEYERTLRIANQAVKSAYSRDEVLISITHYWKRKTEGGTYAPKDILDCIANKTRKEGNYNWGIAAHPYGYDLTVPAFWNSDLKYGVNGSLNTTAITWTNLEVLQLYLEQPAKLCNGNVRDVYITEGGVATGSSSKPQTDLAKSQQAAGVAYVYYKCTQIPCIKALIYYRLIDNVGDGSFFGLLSPYLQIKPSYEVYKFIDTQWSFQVANQYYDYITWSRMVDGTLHSYPENVAGKDFYNLMEICQSKFDWSTHWDESLIIVRETEEIPPLTQV